MRRGEFDRLAIFWPPRHAKTETVTIRCPVYLLEHDPTERILITGYNERMARRFSRKARTIAKARIALSKEKSGADEWDTEAGGGIVARGVGTPPTGFGFGWIFIDDPIKKREEAESEVYREKAFDWYTDDLYTRLEPSGKIVMTLTRWHYDDIAAQAIASEPGRWRILKLPALAEADDPLGRKPGAALWPERFPVEALLRIKEVQTKKDGAYAFESLYQQNPTPKEGDFFKVAKLETVDAAPAGLTLCRGWDLASTEGGGAYTAGVLIGKDSKGVWYVLDVARGQWSSDDVETQLVSVARKDGTGVRIHLPQDPGQAGKGQAQQLVRKLSGFNVKAEPVSGSKESRAFSFSAQVNAGNVKLLNGDWNKDFIEELRQFPRGKYKDQCDAAADAFNELALGGEFGVSEFRRY